MRDCGTADASFYVLDVLTLKLKIKHSGKDFLTKDEQVCREWIPLPKPSGWFKGLIFTPVD